MVFNTKSSNNILGVVDLVDLEKNVYTKKNAYMLYTERCKHTYQLYAPGSVPKKSEITTRALLEYIVEIAWFRFPF